MNFDVNTLSTLMQLLSSQKPRESGVTSDYSEGADTSFNNSATNTNTSQSVFAMQNGLGQRVDFGSGREKKQNTSSSNPMSSLFDMMTGKGGNGDMMSSLMPMLMNMMGSKPAQVAQNGNNAQSADKSFEEKLKEAKNSVANKGNAEHQTEQNQKNRQSNAVEFENNMHNRIKSQDKYSPITFAGYTLISSLNKLYMSKTQAYKR